MQIKTIQPIQVLCFETEATMQSLLQFVRVVARRLYMQAYEHDLEITGPVYWIYDGADGQPDTPFQLTIALPVFAPDIALEGSQFKVKTLGSFHCLTAQHLGDWTRLGETYGRLFGEIQQKGLRPSGITREIYLNMDFGNPEGNITEVQIGLTI
jgi:effector-binding domain-containing protein